MNKSELSSQMSIPPKMQTQWHYVAAFINIILKKIA